MWGQSASSDGRGVYGYASSGTGDLAIGVDGLTDSSTGRGVNGYASKSTGESFGVFGATYSSSSGATGVYGKNFRTSGTTYGVRGEVKSISGVGVYGRTLATSGTSVGVYGIYDSTDGSGSAIVGFNESANGRAAEFHSSGDGVWISAGSGKSGLLVAGGTKSASVPTSDGDRLLYNEESTEVWFSDYGFGQLLDGYTSITIDPVFAETVNLEQPYHIFLQVYGNAALFVSEHDTQHFQVQATPGSQDLNAQFSYRLVAKRRGYETDRLEYAPWVTEENPHLVVPTPVSPPIPD